jgi:hypothetical protein
MVPARPLSDGAMPFREGPDRIPSHQRDGGSVRTLLGQRDAPLQDYRERAKTGGD